MHKKIEKHTLKNTTFEMSGACSFRFYAREPVVSPCMWDEASNSRLFGYPDGYGGFVRSQALLTPADAFNLEVYNAFGGPSRLLNINQPFSVELSQPVGPLPSVSFRPELRTALVPAQGYNIVPAMIPELGYASSRG